MNLDANGSPLMIDLPTVPDPRGSLTFAERDSPLPFRPRRSYWVYGVPPGSVRGGHAHMETHEAIIAIAGSFRVALRNPFGEEIILRLDSPSRALYVPPIWWREIDQYSGGAVCLVLASLPYDEADYCRDAGEFFDKL
jgi:dTDP-4-dehydrorhamnose 3,5-epimerase-like enzyme